MKEEARAVRRLAVLAAGIFLIFICLIGSNCGHKAPSSRFTGHRVMISTEKFKPSRISEGINVRNFTPNDNMFCSAADFHRISKGAANVFGYIPSRLWGQYIEESYPFIGLTWELSRFFSKEVRRNFDVEFVGWRIPIILDLNQDDAVAISLREDSGEAAHRFRNKSARGFRR